MDFEKRAEELFLEGYNCSQATFGAFCDILDIPFEAAMKLASPLGGGMGRMREVCGACSGIFMVVGMLYASDKPVSPKEKQDVYDRVRVLADKFREENGSIICRELLGEKVNVGGRPEERTAKYYKTRPCIECVKSAARIMQEYIKAEG